MDHTNLAQRFNEATDALGPIGHGVLVRRARALLGEGDVAGAVAFLRDAAGRQKLPVLGKLAGAVEDWQSSGGKPADLQKIPAWKQGRDRGEAVAKRIDELTGSAGLDALIDTLVAQQREQAAGPERLTGPQPLANIFGQVEKPAAVVEADSHLVPVPLNLDDEPAPPKRAAQRPKPPSAPPQRAVGDRPTSAPPMPLTNLSTAPPARQAANTASVPLPPEAVEEGPTVVTQPPFAEDEDVRMDDVVVPASELVVKARPQPPQPPAPPVENPPVKTTTPTPPATTGSGSAYWVALGLLLVVAVLWIALR